MSEIPLYHRFRAKKQHLEFYPKPKARIWPDCLIGTARQEFCSSQTLTDTSNLRKLGPEWGFWILEWTVFVVGWLAKKKLARSVQEYLAHKDPSSP